MRLITIVTDIGGPVALHDILSELPRDFGAPIVVMQPAGEVLVESAIAALRHTSKLKIAKIQTENELEAGTVYFAESGCGYLPGTDRNHLALVQANDRAQHSGMPGTVGALARLLGSEMTVVFLSGRGDATEIKHVCSALEQCGSPVLVLDRKESVVDELGQCALKFAPSAKELGAAKIVAILSEVSMRTASRRNTTESTSRK